MNEKLPNPMLDALAREAKPADHPSADVLADFIERALAESERQSVTEHLARCGDCRDIVFTASNAAEELGLKQQTAAATRVTPRWRWNLAWAAPLAAVVLLVGGYFVWQRTEKVATGPELASKTVAEAPVRTPEPSRDIIATRAAPPAGSSSVGKSPAMAAPAMPPSGKKAQPQSNEAVARNAATPLPAQSRQPTTAGESPKPAPQAPAIAIAGAMAAPPAPAPKANAFAQSESEAAQQYGIPDSISLAVNRLAASAAQAAHPNWRITPQGKLEHLTSTGWTQAFPEQRRIFRVVAVSGNQVWAGGDGGALFHSSDGGQHWNKASLATGEGPETEAIVSIRFSDEQHGNVATNRGSGYATADGGATWTKQ